MIHVLLAKQEERCKHVMVPIWQLWWCDGSYESLVKYRKLGLTCCYAIQTLCNVIGTSLSEPHTSNNCYVINRTQNTMTMIRLFMHATRIQWCRLQHILIWFVLLSMIVNGVNCSATINGWCQYKLLEGWQKRFSCFGFGWTSFSQGKINIPFLQNASNKEKW